MIPSRYVVAGTDQLLLTFDTPEQRDRFIEVIEAMGQRVYKPMGSSWHGHIVGFYSTRITPVGFCVESEREPGSVQLYPDTAFEPYNGEPNG